MSNEAPYTPPQAPLTNPEMMNAATGSALKAVSLGVMVDILGTLLATLLTAFVYAVYMTSQGMAPPEIQASLQEEASPINFVVMGLGSGFSILAGYICGRIARRHEYRLTAITALCSLLIASAMSANGLLQEPLRFGLSVLVTLACTLLGGHLAARRRALARQA